MAGGRGLKIGIALGDRGAVAVVLGRRGAPIARSSGGFREDDPQLGAELQRVFQELKTGLEAQGTGPTDGATVNVALLPPLADARLLPFPPMRRAEVEAVLTRDVSRYFLGANRPRVVGVRLPGGAGKDSPNSGDSSGNVFAAAASTTLLEKVREALVALGWRCGSLSAAQGSWLAAAAAMKGGTVSACVTAVDGTAHVFRLGDTHPEGVRQIPLDDLQDLAEALGPTPGRVLVLAPPPAFESIRSILASKGWSVLQDPDGWAGAEEGAAARADSGGFELVPLSLAEERRGKRQRYAGLMLAGAVVVLLLSAAAHLWGAHRELVAVQERRASIRSEVGPLLQARDSLTALTGRVQALEELAESAPFWTRSLVELTAVLPEDTYLTSFYASGDSLELEAAGARAGEAIQLLREAGLFEDLRLQGIVEREMDEGERVQERFSLRARLPARGEEGGE